MKRMDRDCWITLIGIVVLFVILLGLCISLL